MSLLEYPLDLEGAAYTSIHVEEPTFKFCVALKDKVLYTNNKKRWIPGTWLKMVEGGYVWSRIILSPGAL